MDRPLSAEERALWARVIRTVRPLHGPAAEPDPAPPEPEAATPAPARSSPAPRPAAPVKAQPGTTLDASWDKRLARGLVQPDLVVDLHGHSLQGAYGRLDDSLERAIARGARLLLLVTGKPPSDDRRPVVRGAIRAAVGDWLAASRHAGDIAAVRGAHQRHGGAGALYIILRRRR
jgi:DNA-nicking Smr family endonuclease